MVKTKLISLTGVSFGSFLGPVFLCLFITPQIVIASQSKTIDLLSISLNELMNVKVNVATKHNQLLSQTPAIISIISREDILFWGYQSVGEALQQVPGLYGINDYVGYNVGVRGINGGQRAYSRIVKVMINGLAVPFRADSTNFLGPELIPIDSIERVEIVRGPVSALYGENAFMGIINVVTRKPERNIQGYRVKIAERQQYALSVNHQQVGENWKLSVAANIEESNSDGLALPEESPHFSDFATRQSKNALSKPMALFIQWQYNAHNLLHEAMFNYSHQDTVAEFLDFGTLSHKNRLALDKYHLSYKSTWNIAENRSWHTSFAFSHGEPAPEEKLDLNSPEYYPKRNFSFEAVDFSSEYHYHSAEIGAFIFGLDFSYDDESLIEIYRIDANTGESVLLSTPADDVVLKNLGAYIQYTRPLTSDTSLTLNLRKDDQNIFGSNTNFRIGFVSQLTKDISAKLLLGSSYKAPAAMQLYAQPLYPGEVIGNPDLLSEDALTLESEFTWLVNQQLAVNLNLWTNRIENKVELLPSGVNVQPLNSGQQRGYGLESEIKWIQDSLTIIANVAYQHTDNLTETLFQGTQTAPTAMYPRLTSHMRTQYQFAGGDRIGLALQYASPRRATNANIRENLLQPYQLDEYLITNFSYVTVWQNWVLQLKIKNLLDQEFTEPGFLGVDIPGRGREFSFNLRAEF